MYTPRQALEHPVLKWRGHPARHHIDACFAFPSTCARMANGVDSGPGSLRGGRSSFGNQKANPLSQGTNQRRRILSGMRPTGKLHLGNLVGALQNWVKLQDEYDSFHFVADWHMLTTGYENTLDLRQDTWEMVADWLACGLDPAKATFFVQSRLPEHAELHLLFSMVTPLGWLERVPTYKEQLENIKDHDINTYGFLGYPLLQAADILMYKANAVPVGEDQVPHVELTREVARRFNQVFGKLQLREKARHAAS